MPEVILICDRRKNDIHLPQLAAIRDMCLFKIRIAVRVLEVMKKLLRRCAVITITRVKSKILKVKQRRDENMLFSFIFSYMFSILHPDFIAMLLADSALRLLSSLLIEMLLKMKYRNK